MSDGISDGYREQERYEDWMERREAACVVLHVVLSSATVRGTIAKWHFRRGERMSPVKVEEAMRTRGRYCSGRRPIDWDRACELLGAKERISIPKGGDEYSSVVEAAIRQLDIMEPDKSGPADETFCQLEGRDYPVWARLLWSLEMDEYNRSWRDRLQALSPFAEKVVVVFEPRDDSRAIDYVISLAKAKGQYLEIPGRSRHGGQTILRVAVVPRVEALD